MPPNPAAPSLARIVALAVAAEGLMTLMDALIKLLSARYPALQIAFLRFGFGLIGAAVYAAWSRPGWPTREAVLYNGMRAVIIVVTATTFFFALARLPLADAIALSFIAPVLIALFGVTLLGERLDWRIAVALAAGFIGMLLIVGGKVGGAGQGDNMNGDVLIGAAAVVISAIGYALNVVVLRHRATRDPLPQIVLFQNLGPALILALPVLWVWTPLTWGDAVLFALLGSIGVTAHIMLTHAFARVEAARLAPVGYVTLAWGVLFGFLFFAEVPGLATLGGAALIALGTLLTQRTDKRRTESLGSPAVGSTALPPQAQGPAPTIKSSQVAPGLVPHLTVCALQSRHLVFESKLFTLPLADLGFVGAGTRHFLPNLVLQQPVLFGQLREMCGKRHLDPPSMVEGT